MASDIDVHLQTVTRAYRATRDELSSLRHLHSTLSALLQASRGAADESRLMGRLEQSLHVACDSLCAHAGAILIRESDDSLVFAVVRGEASAHLLWTRLAPNTGIAGWAAQQRKSTIVNNASMDGRFFDGIDAEHGFRTRSVMASPLLTPSGRALGVIELVNKTDARLFSSADLQSLDLVAHALALVLRGVARKTDTNLTSRLAAMSAPAPKEAS